MTSFLYDGVNLIGEYDGAGNMTKRYMHTMGADQPWVEFSGSAVGPGNATYLYANYQGSIDLLPQKSRPFKTGIFHLISRLPDEAGIKGRSAFRSSSGLGVKSSRDAVENNECGFITYLPHARYPER